MSDFWNEITFGGADKTASLDEVLNTKISDLVDRTRHEVRENIARNFQVGDRVASTTNNGLVIPNRLPFAGTKGTVVQVKTATGDVTSLDGEVFVQWDGRGEKIDRVPPEFLRKASMRVASLDDFVVLSSPSLSISAFVREAKAPTEGELIHKATRDLWTVKVGDDGQYEIERLFDNTGEPLKG